MRKIYCQTFPLSLLIITDVRQIAVLTIQIRPVAHQESTMEADYKRTAMGYSNTGDTEGTSFGLMYELSRNYALSNNSSSSRG